MESNHYVTPDDVTAPSDRRNSINSPNQSPDSSTSSSRLLIRSKSENAQRESPMNLSQHLKSLKGTPIFVKAKRFNQAGERRDSNAMYNRGVAQVSPKVMSSVPQNVGYTFDEIDNNNAPELSVHRNSDVFLQSTSTTRVREYRFSSTGGNLPGDLGVKRHSRTSSIGGVSYVSRISSVGDVIGSTPPDGHHASDTTSNTVRLSRSSTRRSMGREWTRNHWDKVKDLEQESERARRCSKLSSGFAPLMVFGGLVFVCIGISASTNTGKDSARLKQLSSAPLAMGIFMLALGLFLIGTWFGCRSRAKNLDQRVLHGSRRNSVESDSNLIDAVLAKLQSHLNGLAQDETSQLNGVTVDGVMVQKPTSSNQSSNVEASQSTSTQPFVVRETTV